MKFSRGDEEGGTLVYIGSNGERFVMFSSSADVKWFNTCGLKSLTDYSLKLNEHAKLIGDQKK